MTGVVDRKIAKKVVVRKKEHFFDRKLLWFTGWIIALTILIYTYPPGGGGSRISDSGRNSRSGHLKAGAPYNTLNSSSSGGGNFDGSPVLELGHDLFSRGLYSEAVSCYGQYLKTAAPSKEAAALAFKAGDICKDRLHHYEEAAKFYLLVRYFDGESPFLKKTGLRIVTCLEALGKTRESQSELDQIANIDKKGSVRNPLSPIVAQAPTRDFTLADIDNGIAALPKASRKLFEGPDGRMMFLQQQLLLPHLLYQLGKKEGLDQSGEVMAKLEEIRKNLVVQEVLKKRLSDIDSPTDEELKMYYKANKEKYKSDFESSREAVAGDYMVFARNQKLSRILQQQMKVQNVKVYPSVLTAGLDSTSVSAAAGDKIKSAAQIKTTDVSKSGNGIEGVVDACTRESAGNSEKQSDISTREAGQ